MPPLQVGLTGGIGSGKSTVAAMLLRLGAGIVDADALAHEVTAPGGVAIDALRGAFGAAAIAADGGLDRAWMRRQAFAETAVRRRLEQILHPLVRTLAAERAAAVAARSSYVVLVIPLLVEAGNWSSRFRRVLVVDCSTDIQLERVTARPGIDRTTAKAILDAQASRSARLDAADDVVFNEGPLDVVAERVRRLHAHYLEMSGRASDVDGV